MAKFPSQRKLLYETGNIADDTAYNALTSGGTSGVLNLPKDLSILNRRGYASTTRKGVPLIYQVKLDFYMHNFAGQGLESAVLPADTQTILKVKGAQNNWVMRNAAVKWHAAREEQLRSLNIPKKNRGAYAHEIRYVYDSSTETYLVPVDGDGSGFTGGTWDTTTIAVPEDDGFKLALVGTGTNVDTGDPAPSQVQIGFSYLSSRAQVPSDSNLESSDTPAHRSILNAMLAGPQQMSLSVIDDIYDGVRDEQDNPPYDVFTNSDLNHDITEPVELGRAVAGFGNAYGSVIVDIPFGICDMTAKMTQSADTANIQGLICAEVLDIYEMQG
jgi:hypothetical protein